MGGPHLWALQLIIQKNPCCTSMTYNANRHCFTEKRLNAAKLGLVQDAFLLYHRPIYQLLNLPAPME